jgi:hypothetical protein
MAITASALCVEMFEKYDIHLIRFIIENILIPSSSATDTRKLRMQLAKALHLASKYPLIIMASIYHFILYFFLMFVGHWSDIQTTTILMFLTLNVITFLASHIVMALVQDMYHIVPESIARRLKITGKTLSTSTLTYQAIGLASTTALLVIPLGFLTAFVFTKEAKVVVIDNGVGLGCPIAGALNDLCLRTVYDETPYSKLTVSFFLDHLLMNLCSLVRINAELPWTVVLLGIMGAIVTFAAWYKRPEYIPDVATKPSAEIIGSETRIVNAPLHDVESLARLAS